VVNNLTGTAFTRGTVQLQSDGTPWRPLVHAEDISRAFLAALAAPRDTVHNEAFNVGRPEDVVRVRDIAASVSRVFDAPVTFAAGATADKRNYKVDFTKIHKLLPGFAPEWTIELGIEQLAADMSRIGLSREDFDGPRYVRLQKINELKREGLLDDMLRTTGK
jgi:nucleoside-diphosphate-sugar epimerase